METQERTREIFHADFCQDQLAVKPMDTLRYAVPCSMGNPTEEGLQPPAAAKEGTRFQIQRLMFGGPGSCSALVRGWGHSSLFGGDFEASSEKHGDQTRCSFYITQFHEREMQYDSCSSLEPIKGKKGRRYRRIELSVSHNNILTGGTGRSRGLFGICKTDRQTDRQELACVVCSSASLSK